MLFFMSSLRSRSSRNWYRRIFFLLFVGIRGLAFRYRDLRSFFLDVGFFWGKGVTGKGWYVWRTYLYLFIFSIERGRGIYSFLRLVIERFVCIYNIRVYRRICRCRWLLV